MEEWKVIGGASNYYVSNYGNVKSYKKNKKGKLLKKHWANNNCEMVNIYYDDGTHKYTTVHRLVAKTFIPNPNNLPEVNHKDENRKNNNVVNLEWCDGKYNTNYGTGRLRQVLQTSFKVNKYNTNNELIATFYSIKNASIKEKISQNTIRKYGNTNILYKNHFWEVIEN